MNCIGVKFAHLVGGRFKMPDGLDALMRDREVGFVEGDVIEVSIHVTTRDRVPKSRRLVRWLKQIGEHIARPATAALLAAVLLTSCEESAEERARPATERFNIEKLFDHEGCTVYRFHDGYDRYYARCGATTVTSYPVSNGETTRLDGIATDTVVAPGEIR
jgi:hypothetical protein